MPTDRNTLHELLSRAGIDPRRSNDAQHAEFRRLEAILQTDPAQLIVEVLKAQSRAELATRNCRTAAEAAEKLEELLHNLLEAGRELWHLAFLDDRRGADGPVLACCRRAGVWRALPVHPDVDVEQLRDLKPWEYAEVNPKEGIVVGVCANEALYELSLGEVVELKSYVDPARGLVAVNRTGHAESVVQLAEHLRERQWPMGTRFVLLRDNESLAVTALPSEETRTQFDYPIASIQARLEDLGGLEQLQQRLAEEVVAHLLERAASRRFDLEPLGGVLLYSYKPGMGKTTFVQAFVRWLHELGQDAQQRFDVEMVAVKPNATKSMWHGGDARLIRELGASVRGKIRQPRSCPLVVVVCFDEIDSLNRRSGGNDLAATGTSAHNDGVQALLAEMDEVNKAARSETDQPAWVLWVGMTNRPDMIDPALKRAGRMGDLYYEMPDITVSAAEAICEVYCRHPELPWSVDGEIRADLTSDEIRAGLLRPALAAVFSSPVLRYLDDHRRPTDVTVGQLLAGVHYSHAIKGAKRRAAMRYLMGYGIPAVGYDDLVDSLWEIAGSVARQLKADRLSLIQQLRIRTAVTDVELLAETAPPTHHYLRHDTT